MRAPDPAADIGKCLKPTPPIGRPPAVRWSEGARELLAAMDASTPAAWVKLALRLLAQAKADEVGIAEHDPLEPV